MARLRTERLATDFPALGADLVPGAAVHLVGAVTKLTGQGDNFGNNELCNTARIGEGGVEDSNAVGGSVFEVDLVRADAEAANDEQVLGLTQDLLGQLGLGANTNDMHVPG